jgi:hypothetical protein
VLAASHASHTHTHNADAPHHARCVRSPWLPDRLLARAPTRKPLGHQTAGQRGGHHYLWVHHREVRGWQARRVKIRYMHPRSHAPGAGADPMHANPRSRTHARTHARFVAGKGGVPEMKPKLGTADVARSTSSQLMATALPGAAGSRLIGGRWQAVPTAVGCATGEGCDTVVVATDYYGPVGGGRRHAYYGRSQ